MPHDDETAAMANLALPLNEAERHIAPALMLLRLEGRIRPADTIFTTTLPEQDVPLCFNVTEAQACAEGRPLVEIPLEEMALLCLQYDFDPEHVMQVDHLEPGIAAVIYSPYEKQGILVVIDGTHRLVRSLLAKTPYLLRVLTVKDSYECLMIAPQAVLAGRALCHDVPPQQCVREK